MHNCTVQDLHTRQRFSLFRDASVSGTFIGEKELSIFSLLINLRRPLPIYLGPSWRCYVCTFESNDFHQMAQHIIYAHEGAPMEEDEDI